MRAPRSWINEFVPLSSSISDEAIAEGLVKVGFEVEEIIASDITGPLLVSKVLEIEELKEHKKPIRYVTLDCGEGKVRYVICGATNFKVGDLVVVALPGAVLPGDFAISARQTYGKTSDGMICSARELGMGEDHSGIIVLSSDEVSVGHDALEYLDLHDTIFDIAVNPDRGYALSIRGIAREVAAALDLPFTDPVDALRDASLSKSGTPTRATIEGGASLMYVRTIDGYRPDSPVPAWMRHRLEKSGMRSISLAVDVTNYVMLELGQPLHAFDADKVQGALVVRPAGKKEKFTTLDGQERELDPDDLVVADEDGAVLALAGTMGGAHSEISASTSRISIEAVRFDPISIAKNSRRHKLSTEASRRFERGVDVTLAEFASLRAMNLLVELGAARYVGTSVAGEPLELSPVVVEEGYIAHRLGVQVERERQKDALEKVGCSVALSGNHLTVTPPPWRPDLLSAADLSEEVARVIGYDAIPSLLPTSPRGAELTSEQKRKRAIANSLVAQGYVEVSTFPFVSQEKVEAMGFLGERAASYKIANPMSEEEPWLRPHIVPGLLETAQRNFNRGFKDFAIFEMGAIFRKSLEPGQGIFPPLGKRPSDEVINEIFASVPTQLQFIGGVLVGHTSPESWSIKPRPYEWSDAVAAVESLLHLLGLTFEKRRSDFAPWHPGRCVEFLVEGKVVSHAGELHPRTVSLFSLPQRTSAWAINLDALAPSPLISPRPIGVMPAAVQDVALIVDSSVSAGEVEAALRQGAGDLLESITLFDRYDQIGDGKVSLAFTLTWRAPDRTLTGDEVAAMRTAATHEASKATGAVLRTQ